MKDSPKVLIIDDMHESISDLLASAGFKADYRPEIQREEALKIIEEYDGIVVRSKLNVDKEFLDRAVNLKFVARAGAGIDKIDYPYLTSKGIKLINAPEGNRDSLGEHTVGMLLSLLHKLHIANLEVRAKKWDREGNRGWELGGKTVGIYGFGYMGSAFAERLTGFGCRIITYDKYKTNIPQSYVEQVDLETFRAEVEILSIHVPLTSETKYLFDDEFLALYPQLQIILNTSRGEVLKLSSVVNLLASGKLIGAGLDVLENEKMKSLTPDQELVFEKLSSFPNVIFTPHVAGWTFESYRKINEVLVNKLKKEGLAIVK